MPVRRRELNTGRRSEPVPRTHADRAPATYYIGSGERPHVWSENPSRRLLEVCLVVMQGYDPAGLLHKEISQRRSSAMPKTRLQFDYPTKIDAMTRRGGQSVEHQSNRYPRIGGVVMECVYGTGEAG